MRKLLILTLVLFFTFFSTSRVAAIEEFETKYESNFIVSHDAETLVRQKIQLINKLGNIYASSYSYIIGSTKVNNIRAYNSEGEMNIQVDKRENSTEVKIFFADKVVGKGNSQNFTLEYRSYDFASKKGKVMSVGIPQLNSKQELNSFQLYLQIPQEFGEPAFISPKPTSKKTVNNMQIFSFENNQIMKSSVIAFFGDKQIFDFDINYYLQNDRNYKIETEIALIPDTTYQKVIYQKIDPLPKKISRDNDGNWLAVYELNQNEELSIKTLGIVEVSNSADNSRWFNQTTKLHTEEQTHWPFNDPLIASVSADLGDVKEVYDYVVNTLSYDYERITGENNFRRDAVWSLQNPKNAVCMDFTDLFITLARSKNIYSRELNGYAYTDNPALRPISLEQDILHAWPQYWNNSSQIWTDVDPTWENTTGGIDHFSYRDLNRIVFVIHGEKSDYPIAAGSYRKENDKNKNININIGADFTPEQKAEIIKPSSLTALSGFSNTLSIFIKNTGNTALYQIPISVTASDPSFLKSYEPAAIDFIAPYMSENINIIVESSNYFRRKTVDFSVTTPFDKKNISMTFEPIYIHWWKNILGTISGWIN